MLDSKNKGRSPVHPIGPGSMDSCIDISLVFNQNLRTFDILSHYQRWQVVQLTGNDV